MAVSPLVNARLNLCVDEVPPWVHTDLEPYGLTRTVAARQRRRYTAAASG